jgi:transcriptional regulator with XRE-family HTH domain
MPHIPGPEVTALIGQARIALGLNQEDLGKILGASRSSATRWEAGRRHPSVDQIQVLARAVHPKDPRLAAALAAEGGTTLEQLGIVRVQPPQPPAPVVTPPAAQPRPFPPIAPMVDSVLHAASHAIEPRAEIETVRVILAAGFARARDLGLTVDEVAAVLAPPPPLAPKPATRK